MYITVCTNWSRVAPYVEAVQTNWCICLNIHLWGWISNPIYFWIHFFVRFTCLICSIQNKSCSLCLSGGPKLLFTLTAEEQRGRGGINKDRRQHLYHTGRFSTKKKAPDNQQSVSLFLATGQLPWIGVFREETEMHVEWVCGSFSWLTHFVEFH